MTGNEGEAMNKDDFAEFSGSLTANVLSFNPDAIPAPSILRISMTRGKKRIADELSKQFGRFERVIIDVDGERHEFGADSFIRLLESYEDASRWHEQAIAATLGADECAKCAEGMGAYADSLCDSIKERLGKLLRCLENDYGIRASWDGLRRVWTTESATAELDFIEDKSRWHELFGTPERAVRTLVTVREECEDIGTCYPNCPFDDAPACPSSIEPRDCDALLEWLEGDA